MIRYGMRHRLFAAGLAGLAGCVDAIGFLKLGGLFVSFMSGNSTRMAVGFVTDPAVAFAAARLIAGFVGGVVIGTLLADMAGSRRSPVVLAAVALLLMLSACLGAVRPDVGSVVAMTVAMGAMNTVFRRDGEVSVGVTYMTGTLVRMGQHLAGAIRGGPWRACLAWLGLWCGLVAGATAGALLHARSGDLAIWLPATAAGAMAIIATFLGPVEASSPDVADQAGSDPR